MSLLNVFLALSCILIFITYDIKSASHIQQKCFFRCNMYIMSEKLMYISNWYTTNNTNVIFWYGKNSIKMKKNIYNNVPIKRYLLRKSVPLTWVGLLFLFSKITELTDCYLYV